MLEEQLDLETTDGAIAVRLTGPEGTAAHPAVIFYMDAFGIRPALLSMARRLASAGYVVALPDLYYRTVPFVPFDASRVFTEGPERDRFKAMIASITNTMVMADTAVVIDALGAHPSVLQSAGMAAVGYCMGGGFALSAAGTFPAHIRAAASFHGGSLATDKADSPHRLAPRIRGRLYVGVAEIDPSFAPEQQARLAHALEAAGVAHTIETYAGARHGFAVTGHPVYDAESSERHWQRLLAFLGDAFT